jgi:hypothetical protein
MKKTRNLFSSVFNNSKLLLTAFCVVCLSVGSSFAASRDGCEDTDKNPFINQRLALCSTHAYNIGATSNPKSYAERESMNEVVGLKTTIMTQQMKKQYDYLETTIKRFKTQLEKAILVSQMEAAGASSENSGASGKSKTVLGEDCTGKNRTDTVYCLRQNYAKMRAAVDAKNFGNDLKDQIVKDSNALNYMDKKLMAEEIKDNKGNIIYNPFKCNQKSYLTQTTISECLGKISGGINELEEGGKSQAVNPYKQLGQY